MDADALPARINSCGRWATDPFWRLGPERTRTWTDLDLWLVVDGEGAVATPVGVVELRPGTCLIMRGGEPYEFRIAKRQRVHHYFVHFDFLERGRAVPPSRADLPPRHRHSDDWRLLADLIERTIAERAAGDDARRADRWFAAALLEVARIDRGVRATDPRAAAIDALCARVRAEPAEDWRVERWARDAGISADHFARLFRARAACSPRAFLTRARFDLARALLRESDHAIADVARLVGYHDAHFFSRHFSRHHGRSPAAFRRAARG